MSSDDDLSDHSLSISLLSPHAALQSPSYLFVPDFYIFLLLGSDGENSQKITVARLLNDSVQTLERLCTSPFFLHPLRLIWLLIIKAIWIKREQRIVSWAPPKRLSNTLRLPWETAHWSTVFIVESSARSSLLCACRMSQFLFLIILFIICLYLFIVGKSITSPRNRLRWGQEDSHWLLRVHARQYYSSLRPSIFLRSFLSPSA